MNPVWQANDVTTLVFVIWEQRAREDMVALAFLKLLRLVMAH